MTSISAQHAPLTTTQACAKAPKKNAKQTAPKQNTVTPPENVDILEQFDLDTLTQQRGLVGRFLWVLQTLHRLHRDEFSQILSIKGRTRLYFSQDKQCLLDCSASSNPKKIGTTGYWVITNSNTERKRAILRRVAKKLGYGKQDAERICQWP